MTWNAQAAYPWVKLEWKGPSANNNGKVQISTRQLAERLACNHKTAARALQELQEKGWLVATQAATLGLHGKARATLFEVTEFACPPRDRPRLLFREWQQGRDFPVAKVMANNPEGRNKNRTLSQKTEQAVPKFGTNDSPPVPKDGTACPKIWDEQPRNLVHAVPKFGTSLSTMGTGSRRAFRAERQSNEGV